MLGAFAAADFKVACWAGWPEFPGPSAGEAIKRVAGCTVAAPVLSRNANNSLGALCIQFGPRNQILGGIGVTASNSSIGSKSLPAQTLLLVLG